MKKITTLILMLAISALACADVKLPQIITDHMILQRGVDAPIWGWADQGERVTVRFAGQTKTATPDKEGRWQIKLDPLKASKQGRELVVKGNNTVTVKDVLVGEVWLASGQSNMVSGIKQVPGEERDVYSANKTNDLIRLFKADGKATRELTNDTGGRWMLTSEQALHTSAVAFFFAHKLYQELDVPVAYIIIANLGSKIEPFIPTQEYAPINSNVRGNSNTYNSMIAPITSYAIKGVIWYQGESNRGSDTYFQCIKALSAGWSRAFGIPNIPIHQVQIAPYSKAKNRTSLISDCVWSAQQKAAKEIKGVTVIPIHDTDIHVMRIHPRRKKPVGERLAAQALKNQYGKKVTTSGPVFSDATLKGNKVLVSFSGIDKGLTTKDGKAPTFFQLSADGNTFIDATATLKGNHVEVQSDELKAPKYVRMGWYDTAIPTLKDKNGWPVLAFPAKFVTGSIPAPKINMTKLHDEVRAKQVKDMKFGMFICWSFSTFYGQEWTPTLDKDSTYFRATGCDTDQWCETAKAAGMNYILFLSKHHDGFCLWDTATTDKKVTNSPLGIDVLAKLRKSCDKYGIKLALYFSEGDWNWPGAVDGKGTKPGGVNPEMKKAQLKELLTNYGPIEFWWIDHAVGTGGLDHEKTVEYMHEFQPNTFVGFNHGQPAGRLCLREMGRPGKLGDAGATVYNKKAEGSYKGYLAAEFTYPILPRHKGGAMWFYSLPKHDNLCKPADGIYKHYLGAEKFGNIFSIDVGPNYAGRLRDIDVKTLRQVGEMIRSGKSMQSKD